MTDSHAYSSLWKILELMEAMSTGKKHIILVQRDGICLERQHHDFLRVNFSLGTDDSPSFATSGAVNGGLVASGDGTAAAYPNWV